MILLNYDLCNPGSLQNLCFLTQGQILSSGNMKMSIPTFTLPTRRTCPGRTPLCEIYCYGKIPEYRYKVVSIHREKMLALTLREEFVPIMNLEIIKCGREHARVHESGDFYNQEYLNKWFDIVRSNPGVVFLAFTKCYDLDYSKKPDNFNIYLSVFPDSPTPPEIGLPKAYTIVNGFQSLYEHWTSPDSGITGVLCPGNCDTCMHCFKSPMDPYDVIFPLRIAAKKGDVSAFGIPENIEIGMEYAMAV